MDEMHNTGGAGIQKIADCLVAHVTKALDENRLNRLKKDILAHLARGRFRGVLINVSGASILGSYGTGILMETARAVEMMGAKVVFVGFRPGVAAALVEFDVDISGIRTAVTTADAFDLLDQMQKEDKAGLQKKRAKNGPVL